MTMLLHVDSKNKNSNTLSNYLNLAKNYKIIELLHIFEGS